MTKENKWSIDQSHSEITFKVRHLMIANVKGSFQTFDASIYTTDRDFTTAEIDLWIDASSISTGDLKRDEHLKSPDFFDVEKHKQINFVSTTIAEPGPDGTQELWGELTILGVTKNMMLNVEFGGIAKDSFGNEKAGFTVSGTIKRSEWGLAWNNATEAGGILVSDDVKISCEIELINLGQQELEVNLDHTMTKRTSL